MEEPLLAVPEAFRAVQGPPHHDSACHFAEEKQVVAVEDERVLPPGAKAGPGADTAPGADAGAGTDPGMAPGADTDPGAGRGPGDGEHR